MAVTRRITGELEERLVKAVILNGAVERIRLKKSIGVAGGRLEEAHWPRPCDNYAPGSMG
jgi:hypothetical protein